MLCGLFLPGGRISDLWAWRVVLSRKEDEVEGLEQALEL